MKNERIVFFRGINLGWVFSEDSVQNQKEDQNQENRYGARPYVKENAIMSNGLINRLIIDIFEA